MSTDLEVLPVDSAEHAPPLAPVRPAGRRRRWPLRVTIGLLVAAITGFPLRLALLRSDTRRIDRVWSQVSATNAAHTALVQQLLARAVLGDEFSVAAAERALAAEAIGHLEALNRSLPALIPDAGLIRLRNQVRNAIHSEVTGLRATPADPPDVQAASARIAELLGTAMRRFHADSSGKREVVRLHGADQAIAALSRITDQPTGAQLAVTTDQGVHVVDLDAGQDHMTGLASGTQLIAAGPRVFVVEQGKLALLPADLRGPGLPLGPVTRVLSAGRGRVWVIAAGMVRLVDDVGATVSGPFPADGLGNISGAADAGLVVQVPGGIRVVDPATGNARLVTSTAGLVLAAAGDTVAWAEPSSQVHVTSVSTGRDQLITYASQTAFFWNGGASVSPDGHTFVIVAAFEGDTPRSRLLAVDVPSGRTVTVSGTVLDSFDIGNLGRVMAWSADSRELFFTYPTADSVGLWQVRDAAAHLLRYRPPGVGGLAVMP